MIAERWIVVNRSTRRASRVRCGDAGSSGAEISVVSQAERHARGFTCWGQFVAMLFCQLGRAQSLREICGRLAASEGKSKHLGLPGRATRHSSLRQRTSTLATLPERVPATTGEMSAGGGQCPREEEAEVPFQTQVDEFRCHGDFPVCVVCVGV